MSLDDKLTRSTDPRSILERKRLPDGSELQLITWESDFIQPGRVGYQLALVSRNGVLTRQFPTDWGNYTEQQIRAMYTTINTREDFEVYTKLP